MNKTDKIYVAGHKGMVGSAIVRVLYQKGFNNLILKTHKALNLLDEEDVRIFFRKEKPDYVFLAAARVGGIRANIDSPADFLRENITIQNNIIYQSYLHNVRKLCFLGSSCIYPRECPQPMKEDYLLTGPLEPTNEGYALAKIAGLKLCEFMYKQYNFNCISVMPCNLYGVNDSFDPVKSHVLSALVKKFVDAADEKKNRVTVWGTGNARREFMYVDDCAHAVIFLMTEWNSPEIINVGWGKDVTIKELAIKIKEKCGYNGSVKWDTTKPDGMMRKCLDISKLTKLGFKPSIDLDEGIKQMVKYYRDVKLKGVSV